MLDVAGGLQAVNPGVEDLGRVHVQRLVGAEGGKDPGGKSRGGNRLVVGQVVDRIVGGADRLDVELVQNSVGVERGLCQRGVGLFPDARRALLVEQFVDPEVAFEFQMGPLVERIAQGVRHGASPCEELVVVRRVAGAEALFDAVGPHGAPLVVVALEPDLKQVGKAAVGGNVVGRKMAVVVEDRLSLGVLVEQTLRGFGVQQKIFVDERHDR